MSKTVLITGATGNLGAKISAHLAAKGYNLRLICLNPAGRQDVITADLTRYDHSWARVFAGVDAVIHLAGEARPTANWDTVLPLNITLLLNVFEAMRQYGGSKMIFASSNWVMAGYRFSTEKITTKLSPTADQSLWNLETVRRKGGRKLGSYQSAIWHSLVCGLSYRVLPG